MSVFKKPQSKSIIKNKILKGFEKEEERIKEEKKKKKKKQEKKEKKRIELVYLYWTAVQENIASIEESKEEISEC